MREKQEVCFKSLEISAIHSNTPLQALNSQKVKRSLSLFQEQLKQAKDLYTKKDFSSLEALLLHLALQLPPPVREEQKSDFWKAVSPLDQKEWQSALLAQSAFLRLPATARKFFVP